MLRKNKKNNNENNKLNQEKIYYACIKYYLNWMQTMFAAPYSLHSNYMHPFHRIKRSQACINSIMPERGLLEQDFQSLTYYSEYRRWWRNDMHKRGERERETHTHLLKFLS